MYFVEYESDYLKWSPEDFRYHSILKTKSANQFAYIEGNGILVNKKEFDLFQKKYMSKSILKTNLHASIIFNSIKIDAIYIYLNEVNEKSFFRETEFGGCWSIIYTTNLNAEQVIDLVNNSSVLTSFPDYINAILSKEFENERGVSCTRITSREPLSL